MPFIARLKSFLGRYDNTSLRYTLPLVSVSLAILIDRLISPYLSILPPFLIFIAAIMVTAWYARFYAALCTVALSALAVDYFFIPSENSFALRPADIATLVFFVLEGTLVAYCIDYLRGHQEQLRRSNTELSLEVDAERDQLRQQEEKLRDLMSELVLAGERERKHLAEELHDYLAQLLTLAEIKQQLAKRELHRSLPESERYIHATQELLKKSLQYVRTVMAELHPAELERSGLAAALRSLGMHMSRHGLTVNVSIGSDLPVISKKNAVFLYQAGRELLMNVVKHAEVHHASLSLAMEGNQLVLSVEDIGQGFDTAAPTPQHHFGLSNIKDRMAAMGGTANIKSCLGQGTAITLRLPCFPPQYESSMAASGLAQDRVMAKPTEPPGQLSLPL